MGSRGRAAVGGGMEPSLTEDHRSRRSVHITPVNYLTGDA